MENGLRPRSEQCRSKNEIMKNKRVKIMKIMKYIFLISSCLVLYFNISFAGPIKNTEVTIYNDNFAFIWQTQNFDFKSGVQDVYLTDIPSGIEPTSVCFKSLTSPKDCRVEEQLYRYDLNDLTKLLRKYIHKEINWTTKDGEKIQGILIGFDEENVYLSNKMTGGSIDVVQQETFRYIKLPELSQDIIISPTLIWKINNQKRGRHLVDITYLTKGLKWSVDYIATIKENSNHLDWRGWITIDNQTEITYTNAKIKLVDDNAQHKTIPSEHVYTLNRQLTLPHNEIMQFELINTSNVPFDTKYVYDAEKDPDEVTMVGEFKNIKWSGLGVNLPGGRVRTYKIDVKDRPIFIGADSVSNIPKEDTVRLFLGITENVKGTRERISLKKINSTLWEETYNITIHNNSFEDIDVIVTDHFAPNNNWDIIKTTHDYIKKDTNSAEYNVRIDKNFSVVIKYTVRLSTPN